MTNISSASRVHKGEWTESGVPFFRSSDVVSAFKGEENEKAFISYSLYEGLAKKSGKVQEGDVLITGGGSIGIPYLVKNNEPLYFKDADLLWLKQSRNLVGNFLYTFFTAPVFSAYVQSISHIGTIAHYTIEQLKDTPILFPKVDEQQKIGTFFRHLDRLITLHQCNCNMATRPCEWSSGLRAIAWEQRKLGEIVKIRRGLTYKPSDICENGIRVLRSSNIDGDSFVLNCDDVFVREQAVNIDYARENDILITAANGSSRLVGKHAILSQIPDKSTVHGGFMLLGSTEEPYFINASMGSSWYRRFVELFVAGGNGAIGNLNKNDLDNQDIFVPSKKEQTRIGTFFRQLDRLVTLHQRKHVLLT